ncbi:hypothetical protein LPJ63_001673 [Coemansia sp. RSA 2711]|nr:hypothetical protein LPJ63_001673 [Coemansia sp. RSA 2711]KAJ2366293.1 hypothetical protein H4S01_002783 [Coemansia sp. RSA 2610]KAJ2386803.1 hypothetical protein H4S02_003673 [Coemansia sp. RSA 2611]
MDPLFDKLDETVEAALQTLFPPTDTGTSKDAQQRAQDFANQVSVVHEQLAELKYKLDEQPGAASTKRAILEKEVADLRQDIEQKNQALEKYRKILADYVETLRKLDRDNRNTILNNN